MDWINELSDDLLLQILSLVSIDDVVIAKSLVSKKWHSLSSLVSKLEYNDQIYYTDVADYKSFTQFVYRTLLSNNAPVLHKLELNLGPKCQAIDIRIWIETAISHRVRELSVIIRSRSSVTMPRSLFTCKTLEALTLHNCVVPDVHCCLPSLKTMRLFDVAYASLPNILLGCPNLKLLRVTRDKAEDEGEDIIVAVPWLRTLIMTNSRWETTVGVYVIKAPCLEFLMILDNAVYASRHIEYMPNLVDAYLDITQEDVTYEFLRAFASARNLYLCLSFVVSEVPNTFIVFSRLVHLEIRTCAQGWWELLCQILQNSPKLASLKLNDNDKYEPESPVEDTPDCWKWPSSIPKSLETFEWSSYKGRQRDLEMATYLIKNAAGLKKAIFSPKSNKVEAKYRMLKELTTAIFSPGSDDVDPNCGMGLKELVAAIFSPLSYNVEAFTFLSPSLRH